MEHDLAANFCTTFVKTPLPVIQESDGENAFSSLVAATRTLCAAERDTVGMHCGDPAFDEWLRDAETARAAVVAAAEGVVMAMSHTATDKRFRIVALNLEAMLLTQDAGKYSRFAEALLSSKWLYNVPGRGPRAARGTALLHEFRKQLDLLLSLPDYTPEPPCAPAMAMTMPMAA